MPSRSLVTVIETPTYLADVKKVLNENQRAAVVDLVSANPLAGDLMPQTGGVRKLRIGLTGRGKSGGARVIYFYHNDSIPIFLLTAYPKSVKDNLSAEDCNELRKLTKKLVDTYRSKRTKP